MKSKQEISDELMQIAEDVRLIETSHNSLAWTTSRENLEDGDYVGVLPHGGKVFVSVSNGELYPKEYCKQLTHFLKLPNL